MATTLVFLACLASSLFMTGVIMVVQVVHYPLFERVDGGSFGRYHRDHVRLMTYVVFPPMVIELATSVWLVIWPVEGASAWLAWVGLAAAAVAWVATAFVSVPLHNRLALGFDSDAHRSLVRTNLTRVAAWTVHSTALLIIAAQALRATPSQ
jgi:hypothetical protein